MEAPDQLESTRPHWEEAETILVRFTEAWQAGRRPNLKAFLRQHQHHPGYRQLAFGLAKIDLNQRLLAGDAAPLAEGHLADLRDAGVDLDRAQRLELVRLEYDRRWWRGERVLRRDYLERFPELHEAIELWVPLWTCPRCRREDIPLPGETATSASCPNRKCQTTFSLAEVFRPVHRPRRTGLDLRAYALTKELGAGGMGQVYRSRDPGLGRELAIKVLRPELKGDRHAERRFEDEARIAGRLQHPSIVPIHNFGRLDDGRLFFTMKLVEGKTFEELLRPRSGPPAHPGPSLLQVFGQICQAIAYAHESGVIHRDLKPSNVMVGRFGEVQVMDWGLAKELREGAEAGRAEVKTAGEAVREAVQGGGEALRSTLQTRAGDVLGTILYMPPEQARGEVGRVGKPADVFALGATLCEALTGCPPYLHAEEQHELQQLADRCRALKDGEVATGAWEAARARMATIAQRVVDRAKGADLGPGLTRLRAEGIDPVLAAIAAACLEPGPAQRLVDAGQVAERIAKYQVDLSRQAEEKKIADAKAVEAERARRRAVALAVVVLVALVGSVLAAFYFNHLAGENQNLLVREQEALGEMTRTAEENAKLAQEKARLADEKGRALVQVTKASEVNKQLAGEKGRALGLATERLERQFVQEGARRLAAKNLLGALPFFAEPLRIHAASPEKQAVHRLRLAALMSQGPRLLHLWAHEKPVNHAEFSPDGRYAVTASDDGTARLWDAETGQPIGGPIRHDERPASRASWSPHVFAAAPPFKGLPKKDEERPRSPYEGLGAPPPRSADGRIYHAAFDREGRHVVTVSDRGAQWVRVWEVATGKPRTKYLNGPTARTAHSSSPPCFTPDGKRVAIGAADGTIHVWKVPAGQPAFDPPLRHPARVVVLRFSPDGSRLLSGGEDGSLRAWDAEKGSSFWTLSVGKEIAFAAFSSDGKRVLAAGRYGRLAQVIDVATGKPVARLTHRGNVTHGAFSPDGQTVAVAGNDGTVGVWFADTGREVALPIACEGPAESIAFSPDGRWLAIADRGGVRLWDAAAGLEIGPRLSGPGLRVAFSPDGRKVLAIAGNLVRVWGLPADAVPERIPLTPKMAARNPWQALPARVLLGTAAPPDKVSFSLDGGRFVHAPWSGHLQVFETGKRQVLSRCRARGMVSSAALSPDGALVAAGGSGGMVELWEAATGKHLRTIAISDEPNPAPGPEPQANFPNRVVWHVEFSQSSRKLLTASSQFMTGARGFVRLWDVATGRPASPAITPGGKVFHASLSPDGLFVATPCPGRAACVWDAKTGKATTPPMRHDGGVLSARFSTDGRYVVTGGYWRDEQFGASQVWDARTGEPVTAPFKFLRPVVATHFDPKTGQFLAFTGDRWLFSGMGHVVDTWLAFLDTAPILLASPSEAWSWSLRPGPSSADAILRSVRVLSGAKIDDAGGHVEAEIVADWAHLRTGAGKQPAPPTSEERLAWHDRQAAECEAEGRWGAAAWHLERQLRLAPGASWRLHYRCGRATAKMGQWNTSLRHLSEAIKQRPPSPDPWEQRGEVRAQLRLWEGAAQDFEEALKRSADRFKKARGIGTEEVDLRVRLAYVYAARKDAKRYEEQCSELRERLWKHADPGLVRRAAPACNLRPSEASSSKRLVALVREAIRFDRGGGGAFLLAAALYRAGELDLAEKELAGAVGAALEGPQLSSRLLKVMLLSRKDPERAAKLLAAVNPPIVQLENASPTESKIGWMPRLEILLLRDEATATLKAAKAKK